jgi:hypothetical protein
MASAPWCAPGDHTKIIVAASDASGGLAVFDATGAAIAGPHGLGAGTIPLVAANLDGSRCAVQFVSGGAGQLFLLDSALNQVASPLSFTAEGLTFSRDDMTIFSTRARAPPDPR